MGKGRSVKPGRGPSFVSAIASVAACLFGLFWTVTAFSMTRGMSGGFGLFPYFGIIFIILGLLNAAYHLRNATSEERHSIVDIVPRESEPDPLDRRYGGGDSYCPNCGEKVSRNYRFCPRCGAEQPPSLEKR